MVCWRTDLHPKERGSTLTLWQGSWPLWPQGWRGFTLQDSEEPSRLRDPYIGKFIDAMRWLNEVVKPCIWANVGSNKYYMSIMSCFWLYYLLDDKIESLVYFPWSELTICIQSSVFCLSNKGERRGGGDPRDAPYLIAEVLEDFPGAAEVFTGWNKIGAALSACPLSTVRLSRTCNYRMDCREHGWLQASVTDNTAPFTVV